MVDEETQEEVAMQAPAAGGSKKKMIILILAAVVLLGVGVVVILLLTGGAKEDEVDIQALLDDIPVVEEVVEEVVQEDAVNVYQDDFVSFEYPEGVFITVEQPIGGIIINRNLRFWTQNEDGVLITTGLSFNYFDTLEDDVDGGTTFSEVVGRWQDPELPSDILQNDSYSLDDRDVVHIVTGDLSGDTMAIYIPVLSPDESLEVTGAEDVYHFSGAFLKKDVVNEILDLFFETASLN